MATQHQKPQTGKPERGASGKDGHEERKMAPKGDESSPDDDKRVRGKQVDDEDEIQRTRPADETDRGGMRTPGANEDSERRQTCGDDDQTNR